MRFHKVITACLSLTIMLGCSFSAAALDTSGKHKEHAHKGYYKPGAAVALLHDYDGQTGLGELENIMLTLEHHYSAGYISARLLETPELQILAYSQLDNEKLQTGSKLQIPVQVSGTKSGKYYISLEVIYENLSGQRSLRVLSLPIQIGNINTSKGANTEPQKAISNIEKGLVILNAQEVIK